MENSKICYILVMRKFEWKICGGRWGCSRKDGKARKHEVVDCEEMGVWLSCLGCKRGVWLIKEKQYE